MRAFKKIILSRKFHCSSFHYQPTKDSFCKDKLYWKTGTRNRWRIFNVTGPVQLSRTKFLVRKTNLSFKSSQRIKRKYWVAPYWSWYCSLMSSSWERAEITAWRSEPERRRLSALDKFVCEHLELLLEIKNLVSPFILIAECISRNQFCLWLS